MGITFYTLLCLFLLLVYRVLARDWVELTFLVFLARILLHLIIKTSVVGMTLPDAIFVASRYQFNESFL
jgi:hypothetical protein